VRYSSVRREKRLGVPSGQQALTFELPTRFEEPVQRAFTFEEAIAVITERLDRLHSGQNLLSAQVKDLRESLPLQRRPASAWVQRIHAEVVWTRRNGMCPCCQEVPVCNEQGRLPGSEIDHWYGRHRNGVTEVWLCCRGCNQRLNDSEFKAGVRGAFEALQMAVRLVVQARQGRQTEIVARNVG